MRSALIRAISVALVAIGEAQQHGRDVGRVERGGQIVRDRVRIARAAA